MVEQNPHHSVHHKHEVQSLTSARFFADCKVCISKQCKAHGMQRTLLMQSNRSIAVVMQLLYSSLVVMTLLFQLLFCLTGTLLWLIAESTSTACNPTSL